MADNVTFQTTATATPPNATTVATDDVGGVQYQRVKMDIGADGATSPITLLNPMPIGTLPGGTIIVSGTVQALGSIQGVGTFQVLGSVQGVGTFQVLGSVQTVGTSQALGTVQLHGTNQSLGTFQPLAGSVHIAAGSVNAQGVIAHGATIAGNPLLLGGFGSSGTQAAVTDGQLSRIWTDLNGRVQVRGTIDSIPSITVSSMPTVTVTGTVQTHGTSQVLGTVQTHGTSQVLGSVQTVGTSQVLGSVQPLAGSVHIANTAAVLGSVSAQGYVAHDAAAAGNPVLFGAFGSSGTQAAVSDGDVTRLWSDLNGRLQIRGTIDSMPAIAIGTISGGTIQAFGTTEILGTVRALTTVTVTVGTIAEGTINNFTGTIGGGTFQPLLGTVIAIGSVAHGAAADTRPILFGGFGSSGTQVAVDDGDAVRLWADLNGRLQVRGTIDSLPPVTATNLDIRDLTSASDSVAVVGTVQTHGTSQALGTFQPLAGSVHIATSLAGGTIVAVGSAVHGAVADTRPISFGAFGSSGTQVAVDDGDAVRLWADLNGRLQVRGTIDSIPAIVITSGTVGLAGGTQHIGSVQRITGGTIDFIGGTVAIGTVRQLLGTIGGGTVTALAGGFGSYFGTSFTANTTLGTLIAPPASGTRWRLFDLTISASAAGTVLLQEAATGANGTVVWGPLFFAANGGMVQASARGLPARVTAQGLFCSVSVGTVSVTVNYGLET